MPIVAHNGLPTFERLRAEGLGILSPHRARNQDIRELHIGLLNMMPDKALAATERQFLRLVAQSNPIAQFYVHPFTLDELPRGEDAREHIARYYERFEDLREQGLDALIITGANVTGPELSTQPFWEPLSQVIEWAWGNVTSTLCSCLATHAVLERRHGQRRQPRPAKIWGVFPHRVIDPGHPLVDGINTRFDVPHSRWNAVSRVQFREAGLRVLAESEEIGVHLATSADGIRFVFFQGHPEYDTISLLKEYKRELRRYATGELDAYPPFVANYFDNWSQAVLREYRARLEQARRAGEAAPPLPEALLVPRLDNTWHDTAEAVVGNWMGLVYQLTDRDRRKPFMAGIDPQNPLAGLRG
ncbi:homoserine O-succinyltransferase MetA [Acidihalobacter prosperus]|uniref:Homoserine O-succinyltransferase n=1 Tax=Acidihalobacter prosperus TaxID=160660 RepID=A0A1A6C0V9_9GAMM|nr:homoserine O-succinyltransferase [Acidihalobacter prosperus]OBS08188.1 homoserine O-succinyltransferase [Acidihalobacter prosperus]